MVGSQVTPKRRYAPGVLTMPSDKSLFLYLEVEVCGQPTELDHIGCDGMYVKAVRQLNCAILENGGMPPDKEREKRRADFDGFDDYLRRIARNMAKQWVRKNFCQSFCPTGQEKDEGKCPSSAKSPSL